MGVTSVLKGSFTDINDKMLAVQNMTMKAFIPRGKTRCAHILVPSLPITDKSNKTSLVRLLSSSPSKHTSCEDKLRRKMLEKIIRVDHAGEMGASFIYQGQMAVLKNTKSRELIQEMWDHEKAHLAKFDELLVEYQVRPTVLIPVWKLAGFTLGAGCSGDETLRRPGDRDDLKQPDAGREPYRGDQAIPRRRAKSPRYWACSWSQGCSWIQFSHCPYWIWLQECYLDI